MSENIPKFGQSKNYLQNLENQRNKLKEEGKRRKRFDELKAYNKRKLFRNSGEEYFNTKNNFVEGKTYIF